MKPIDELMMLRLRQARRRERPHTAGWIVFWTSVLLALTGLLTHCAPVTVTPQTSAETKRTVDAIWSGDAAAHKTRPPSMRGSSEGDRQ